MELKKIHISDIGKVVTGKTPRTSVGENYGGNIPFLTPSDDLSYKSAPKTTKTLTEQGLEEVKNCLLPPHSVCVSCIGSDLGKVVITLEPTVTNQQFNSIIPNKNFNADFVYYLMTLVGRELNYLSKTSTAVPIINKSSFSNYEVEVPNLETQEKIASILSSLDSKIELNRRINDNLEQQTQALFKSWFVDFEPFRGGKFVDSELGMIPEGWNIQPISSIFNFQEGPGIRNWQYVNNGTKFINIRCINNDIINIQNANMISDEEAQGKYAHFMLKENDIVISCSGTLGRKALVLKEYLPLCLNTSVIRFTPRINRQLGFLYGYLGSSLFLNKQIELASGSVQANFGPIHLKGMSIAIPDNNVLNQFSDIVNSIIQKKKNIISESLRLTNLRDSILPKLMSGKIKIDKLNS